MVGKGLSGCSHRDGEESDFLAVGDRRLVGSTWLEHQVLAAIGGGVGAEREQTRGVVNSELEGRECLPEGLRVRIRGLWI